MHTRTPYKLLALLIISTFLSITSIADELETITVTADFWDSFLQDTTTSISVIDSQDITDRGAQHIENILNIAPNVNMTSGASRARYFQIRGIGERSQFVTPINPSVGLIIDGIDFSRTGSSATLFDIEQIEVLRGPQGTKYGANALAGIITLTSTEPTTETQLHIESALAEYDTHALGIAAGGSLNSAHSLLARGSIYSTRSDGTMKNTFLSRDDTNGRVETTARLHLKWLANDDLSIDAQYLFLNLDNGYDAFTLDNSRTSQTDQPGKDKQKTNAFSLQSQWLANSDLTLETSSSYSNSDLDYSFDEDWSFVGQFDEALFPYTSFDEYVRNRKNTDIDVRLLSNEDGRLFNEKSSWVIGLYYSDKSETLLRNYTFLAIPFSSEYDTSNLAAYAQLDTELTDRLTLTTGLRVEQWSADYRDSDAFIIATDETLYGGKLGLAYELNQDHLSHISLSRGYKAGGVNPAGTLPPENLDFSTEFLWNLEAGINSSWFNSNVKSRITLFYAKRKDLQVKQSLVELRDDGSSSFTDFTDNAASGKNIGLEAELDWNINQSLRLHTSLGLLNADFNEYTNEPDLVGRDQAQAPRYQYAVTLEYDITPGWTTTLNSEGKDDYFLSDRHNSKSDSYELFNASLSYVNSNWTATLWARNLLDKDYTTRGFGSFGNNPANSYAVEDYTQKGEPRMIGFTLAYDY